MRLVDHTELDALAIQAFTLIDLIDMGHALNSLRHDAAKIRKLAADKRAKGRKAALLAARLALAEKALSLFPVTEET